MTKLTWKERKMLPSSDFGLPEKRSYPLNNPKHAANAKARAKQMVEKGKLTEKQREEIDARADKVLAKRKAKTKPKSKTNIKRKSKTSKKKTSSSKSSSKGKKKTKKGK